jgi:hypothetical protein
MITEKRIFNSGDLKVELLHFKDTGWMITTSELVKACGTTTGMLGKLRKKHELDRKGVIVSSTCLGDFKSDLVDFWSDDGMLFISTILNTKAASAFLKEVVREVAWWSKLRPKTSA